MHMKIPKSVRICGFDYKVIYSENTNDGTQMLWGKIDFEKATIEINNSPSLDPQKQCLIFWHEVLHGICRHFDLKLEDQEERIVEMMSRGVYQVIEDNFKNLT